MTVRSISTIEGLRELLTPHRRAGRLIGLVPTMGALHRGHGVLMEQARRECDVVIVTIFVNPTQFNQPSDYDGYPRTFETDLAFCEGLGVDFVFAPTEKEIYPEPLDTRVEVSRLTDHLCGPHRPGHFGGVATVVTKLLLIALPDKAYFGEKDAQQLAVINRMVRDLNIPAEIVAVPTVREADGLALSSRNKHLDERQRQIATVLYRGLQAGERAIASGELDAGAARTAAHEVMATEPEMRIEYLDVVDAGDMQPVTRIEAPVRIAVAAWVGKTRLIDNVLCRPPQA